MSRISQEWIPVLKNREASRLSTGKGRKLGDQPSPFKEGLALNQFSHTRRAFLSELGWTFISNRIPRIPLVGVNVVSTEDRGKDILGHLERETSCIPPPLLFLR